MILVILLTLYMLAIIGFVFYLWVKEVIIPEFFENE